MARATGPDLSVVVPARDVEPYVGTTLDSLARNVAVAAAGGVRVEVVLVDDGSVDGTSQRLVDALPRLPGAVLLRHEVARGLAAARNRGAAVAGGRWLAYLDGDDWLAPGHLLDMARAMESLRVDLVRVDHVRVQGRNRQVRRVPEGRRGVALDPRSSVLPAWTETMVDYPYAWAGAYDARLRDEGLLHFPEHLLTAEDRSFVWRLHLHARSVAVLSSTGICYRRGVATSLTQVGDERQLHFLDAYEIVLQEVAADRDAEMLLPKAVAQLVAVVLHHLGQEQRLTPALRAELRRRSAATLLALPDGLLEQAQRRLAPHRATALAALFDARVAA